MKETIKGKNIIITGASSGIGKTVALRLAKEGANLSLISRNEERLDEVLKECEKEGVKVIKFLADVTKKDEIDFAVKKTIEELGSIDVFFSNAGIYLRCPFDELEISQIRKIMEVNYFGTINCLYSVMPYFKAEGKGSFVSNCSMDGKIAIPYDNSYAASKHAMVGFFKSLRQELRGTNIHLGVIFPGRIDTPQIRHIDCPKISKKNSPEIVANAVVKCIKKKKGEVYCPWFTNKLIMAAYGIGNRVGDWLVRINKLTGEENGKEAINETK